MALPLAALQVPPGDEVVRVMPDPAHTMELPLMPPAVGMETIVTIFTAVAVPQLLLTV
jgi:hypothetical protein